MTKILEDLLKLSLSQPILIVLLLIPAFSVFGQIVFEPGYLIDNDGNKIDCLIKNREWIKSPTKIEYRICDTTTIEKTDIEEIKAFQVANYKDLKKIVETYNECMGSANQIYDLHKNKGLFNLYIHGGAIYSTFYMTFYPNTSINVDYGRRWM